MKKLLALVVLLAIVISFGACYPSNRAADDVFYFHQAVIRMPDDTVISGSVEAWTDFSDGDQLQVKIDGVWYLTHFSNAVLIAYPGE